MERKQLYNLIIIAILVLSSIPMVIIKNSSVQSADTYFNNWYYSANITINNSFIATNLSGFPLLITIPSSIGVLCDNGNSLRFSDTANTTTYPYEIDYWNNSGNSFVWVNISHLSSTINTTVIMYYGNPFASSQASPVNVWDNNYVMVHHLTGAAYSDLDDSTNNNNNVTAEGNVPVYNENSMIGKSVLFDGSNDYLRVDDSPTFDFTTFTMEVFCKSLVSPIVNEAPIGKYSAASAQWRMFFTGGGSAGKLTSVVQGTGGGNILRETTTNIVSNTAFNYFVSYWDGSTTGDGINISWNTSDIDTTTINTGIFTAPKTTAAYVTIGDEKEGGAYTPWNGYIDEIRLSNIVRNESWRNASFHCMNQSVGFITIVWNNINMVSASSNIASSNIRSDGSHLFMTMEDGIKPNCYITQNTGQNRATLSIDNNNTIEGKYSINLSRDITQELQGNAGIIINISDNDYSFGNGIMPSSWSVKLMVKDQINLDYLVFSIGADISTTDYFFMTSIYLRIDDTCYIQDAGVNRYFTSMFFNTGSIYTITFSNIRWNIATVGGYDNVADVTISNATSSQTLTDINFGRSGGVPSGYYYPISRFYIYGSNAPNIFRLFVDDWTVGTQSNISTSALWPWSYPVSSSVINETQATITGTINNDGSPLQNNSEFNNTVSVLYDTVPHNTTSYTYYFNESSTTEQWDINPTYMNDTNENTYSEFQDISQIKQTDHDSGSNINNIRLYAQTFTPTYDFTLTNIFLKLYRVGIGLGTIKIALQNTIAGFPDGTDITYATMNGDSLGLYPGSWYNFILDKTTVSNGVMYAIVVSASSCPIGGTPRVGWYIHIGSDEYVNGGACISTDDGVTWSDAFMAGYDQTFDIYGYISDDTQLLISYSGNSSSLSQTGNISKIEVRAKSNLSSGSYDGMISLQPVWNNTNGTSYNVFSSSSASWSDWIDITQDVNYSHLDWNDTRELQCRVIANLSSGIAYVGMVEIRVTINRTLDYAYKSSSIEVYDTGDTSSFILFGLSPGQIYFYRNYINTSYINSSSYYYGDEHYFLTKPYAPTSTGATPINETCINISWTKGTGANTTVLVTKTTGYPSSPYDGTIVYNGTGTYFLLNVTKGTPSYTRAWSYDAWSVNPILWHYSDNYTTFNWSIVGFNVFNESNPSQAIGFDLEISNQDGTFVYKGYNLNNTAFINITNIPTGANIYITISNTSYKTRTYVKAVYNATIYNDSYYLPPIYFGGGEPSPENETKMYRLKVIDEFSGAISGATLNVKKYINTSGTYETVTVIVSNGYGEADLWAIPQDHYKIFASASGFTSSITEWIPDPTFWGANYPFIIQMTRTPISPDFWGLINYSFSPTVTDQYSNFTFFYNISCDTGVLEWFRLHTYRYNDSLGTWTYISGSNETTNTGGSLNYSVNVFGRYGFSCSFKITGYDYYTFGVDGKLVYIYWNLSDNSSGASNIDDKITGVLGDSPIYVGAVVASYTALIMATIVTFVMFTFAQQYSGLGVIAVGSILGFMKGIIHVAPVNLNWTAIGVIIIIGVLMIFYYRKVEKNPGG